MARLMFRFSIFTRVGIIALVPVLVWARAAHVAAREQSKEWIVLRDCQFIPNPANDGDSFHVIAGGREYLFRLYFVDAPETDEMTPRRLVEQAKYFSITVPQAIEAGRAAKEFTRQKLAEPFTVVTHMSDAMGQSRLERFYAFVETKEGDLGEQLVRNGLARCYGFKAAPPGLQSSRIEINKLQQFETEAREEKIGAWGINDGRLNAHPQMQSTLNSFVADGNPRSPPVGTDSTTLFAPVGKAAATEPRRSRVETNGSVAYKKSPLGKIDINTATEKELTTVPEIGHVLAARIIAARPFRSADDLKRVSGIGDKKYAQMRLYFQ
jgi:DNA uptake protein ComE-like DNA-binding protein